MMEQFLTDIINDGINKFASDIHFIPTDNEVLVKFRVHGEIQYYTTIEIEYFNKLLSYIKFIAHLDVSEKNKAQSGIIQMEIDECLFNIRASTLPLALGDEACVMRVIKQTFETDIDSLDDILMEHIKKSSGLIIISGPTGSGKSTLMYELIHFAKHNLNRHVISIEDPVEQQIDGIIQVNLNEKANITYESALKAILRCDPDIIMMGEVRDEVVAKEVINASLSGHLVITTLHANDCVGALHRLKDMGIKQSDIMQSLNLIINQRLIKLNTQSHRKRIYEYLSQSDIKAFLTQENIEYETLSAQIKELYENDQISQCEFEKY